MNFPIKTQTFGIQRKIGVVYIWKYIYERYIHLHSYIYERNLYAYETHEIWTMLAPLLSSSNNPTVWYRFLLVPFLTPSRAGYPGIYSSLMERFKRFFFWFPNFISLNIFPFYHKLFRVEPCKLIGYIGLKILLPWKSLGNFRTFLKNSVYSLEWSLIKKEKNLNDIFGGDQERALSCPVTRAEPNKKKDYFPGNS